MDTILFDRHPVDTQAGEPDIPPLLASKAPAGPALHLVQFVGPIQQAWLDAVQAAGASLVQYIAHNAYLVWADSAARDQLETLALDSAFVQYSGPYQPAFKLGSSVEQRILEGADPREVVTVDLQIYDHPAKEASQAVIARLAQKLEVDWWPILAFQNATVALRAADLLTVARLPDVVWIGERFPRELLDEVQGQVMAGNLSANQSGPSGPGYLAWLDGLGFSQDPNDYPVVSVVDDGIGDGNAANGAGDATLTWLGDGATTRVSFVVNCSEDETADSAGGHGHINASIVGRLRSAQRLSVCRPLGLPAWAGHQSLRSSGQHQALP